MKPFATALAVLLLAAAAWAQPTEDVLGRAVPIGQGRPALVFYTNRDTQDALHDEAFRLTWALRDRRPLVVIHVDLSDIPGFFRGAAKGEIRKAARASLAEMARLFRAHGQAPPRLLDDSLFMVADPDGGPQRALGLEKHFKQPYAQALGADGHVLARGPFPECAHKIARAIRRGALVAEVRP